MIHFGVRLRELRRKRGWTQEELAKRAGIQRSIIAHLESGSRHGINAFNLRRLADAFQITMDELANGASLGDADLDNHKLGTNSGH